MRRLALISVFVMFATMPIMFSRPARASNSPSKYQYEDDRLGEHEDRSDKFKFARIKTYQIAPGAHLGDGPTMWSHDYPDSGLHLSTILSEVSKIPVWLNENEYIFDFDDPNLMKYPWAYLCEVGYMELTDAQIQGMREYCLRGGFLVVDDFRGPHMWNFQEHLKRALPEFPMKRLDISHPIFNCFFNIKTLDVRPPYGRWKPEFWGVEDSHGRLMMVINYNNDVSDWWQWSNDPNQPVDDTNGAYKFGVNYVFYALTH